MFPKRFKEHSSFIFSCDTYCPHLPYSKYSKTHESTVSDQEEAQTHNPVLPDLSECCLSRKAGAPADDGSSYSQGRLCSQTPGRLVISSFGRNVVGLRSQCSFTV